MTLNVKLFTIYGISGLAPCMDVLSWGRRDFQISFSNRDTSKNAWNRHWRSFMVDTGILSTIWSFPLTNVKWHSVAWKYTMTTPYWSDFVPNSTFNRNLSGFHRTFATGVACRQGVLTPPDTFGTWMNMFYLLRPILFRTCRYFTGLCSSNIPRYFLDFASHQG